MSEPAWHRAERRKCYKCNGSGKYRPAATPGVVVTCNRCGGTGKA